VSFTRTLLEQRGFVAEADLAAFLNAGYTRAQVIEVLLGVGMKVQQLRGPHRAGAAERSVQGGSLATETEGGVRFGGR
jgi:hypothetical protein